MKRIIFLVSILSMLNLDMGFSNSFSVYKLTTQNLSQEFTCTFDDDRFKNWTDEQYKQYEDSIRAKLYSSVTAQKADSASFGKDMNGLVQNYSLPKTNSYVPNSINLDKSKEVGQIVINSGMSPNGARTYEVPIDVYPGMNGFTPNLSLVYNSQQGNSIMGMGWAVSGVSVISRSGKTMYYDNVPQGVTMDNGDAFVLNGIHLIKTGTGDGYILYESEQGNIKAKGYVSGSTMKYFEVFYPNGNKGVFGDITGMQNYLY